MAAANMRDCFIHATDRILSDRQDTAVVLAEIGVSQFRAAGILDRHPNRIFNVGIREQLLVGFAAGLAKEGIKPSFTRMLRSWSSVHLNKSSWTSVIRARAVPSSPSALRMTQQSVVALIRHPKTWR